MTQGEVNRISCMARVWQKKCNRPHMNVRKQRATDPRKIITQDKKYASDISKFNDSLICYPYSNNQ